MTLLYSAKFLSLRPGIELANDKANGQSKSCKSFSRSRSQNWKKLPIIYPLIAFFSRNPGFSPFIIQFLFYLTSFQRLGQKSWKKISLVFWRHLSPSAHRTPNFTNLEFQFPQFKVLQSVFFFQNSNIIGWPQQPPAERVQISVKSWILTIHSIKRDQYWSSGCQAWSNHQYQ